MHKLSVTLKSGTQESIEFKSTNDLAEFLVDAADGVSKEKKKVNGLNVYRVCNGQLWDLVWDKSLDYGNGDYKKVNEKRVSDSHFKLKYKKIVGDEPFICYCLAVYTCGHWPENSGFSIVINGGIGAYNDYSYKTGQKVAEKHVRYNQEKGSTIWKGEKTFRLSDIKFYQAVENHRSKERQRLAHQIVEE